MLGLLQGVTELFPVSSLGHTVLFPTLFRWHNIVAWQSQTESPWLAFVVMLHVGSAVGLLIYFWRDWIADHPRVLRHAAQAADRDADRAAGLADHRRHDPGRDPRPRARAPAARPVRQAAGRRDLPDGQRLHPARAASAFAGAPRSATLAEREGLNAEGGRRLDTLEFREAAIIGTAQSAALIAGISRDGVVMTGGLLRGLDNADAAQFGFFLATPPILAAGLLKIGDLTGPPRQRRGPRRRR